LLTQITPSVEDDKIVGKLASRVRQAIRPLIPEVEVVGFASGDLSRNKAFGVAVPEVDIIANVNPSVLAERLGGRMGSYPNPMKLDARKLQKSAIRACCDRLVSVGGFKFRRSAFRGDEPKVTLLVPASFGLSNDSIPIDFSVNAVSPLHNAALLTECGQMEPRARELILLVKRWAKDRGICHAAKGHLSPYSWALLSIFFLQAGGANENGPLLPPVADFKMASGLMGKKSGEKDSWASPPGAIKPIGTLFKEFMHFYAKEFDWRKEAISVRTGRRQSPDLSLSLHIVVNSDGTTQVGPSIEDPFDPAKNLSSGMNVASLARLHEELSRAEQMCSSDVCLARLLEPWAPPDHETSDPNSADNNKEEEEEASPKNQKGAALPPWRVRPSAE